MIIGTSDVLRAAQSLGSTTITLGSSPTKSVAEEARTAGLAWERLPEPRPQLTLQIYFPGGKEQVFYLGPHAPHLTPKEIDLLHGLWLQLSNDVAPAEIHHNDMGHFSRVELQRELETTHAEIVRRLRKHLEEIEAKRVN